MESPLALTRYRLVTESPARLLSTVQRSEEKSCSAHFRVSAVVSRVLYRTVVVCLVTDARITVVHAQARTATVSSPTHYVRHVHPSPATTQRS